MLKWKLKHWKKNQTQTLIYRLNEIEKKLESFENFQKKIEKIESRLQN